MRPNDENTTLLNETAVPVSNRQPSTHSAGRLTIQPLSSEKDILNEARVIQPVSRQPDSTPPVDTVNSDKTNIYTPPPATSTATFDKHNVMGIDRHTRGLVLQVRCHAVFCFVAILPIVIMSHVMFGAVLPIILISIAVGSIGLFLLQPWGQNYLRIGLTAILFVFAIYLLNPYGVLFLYSLSQRPVATTLTAIVLIIALVVGFKMSRNEDIQNLLSGQPKP